MQYPANFWLYLEPRAQRYFSYAAPKQDEKAKNLKSQGTQH